MDRAAEKEEGLVDKLVVLDKVSKVVEEYIAEVEVAMVEMLEVVVMEDMEDIEMVENVVDNSLYKVLVVEDKLVLAVDNYILDCTQAMCQKLRNKAKEKE